MVVGACVLVGACVVVGACVLVGACVVVGACVLIGAYNLFTLVWAAVMDNSVTGRRSYLELK